MDIVRIRNRTGVRTRDQGYVICMEGNRTVSSGLGYNHVGAPRAVGYIGRWIPLRNRYTDQLGNGSLSLRGIWIRLTHIQGENFLDPPRMT